MNRTDVHTLVIGSGAAGLNAALQLKRQGIEDILILTEGLDKGTSINTGSDKQTYYKLSLCGSDGDSPRSMADVYFDGGAMHGDLALVEASVSPRAFLNLVNMGVPFPTDRYGQYAGYKTDHRSFVEKITGEPGRYPALAEKDVPTYLHRLHCHLQLRIPRRCRFFAVDPVGSL